MSSQSSRSQWGQKLRNLNGSLSRESSCQCVNILFGKLITNSGLKILLVSRVNQHQSPKYFSAIYSQPPYLLVFLEICWPVTLHIPRLEEGWSFEVLTHTNHLRLQCCRRGFVRDTQLSVSRNVMVLKFKLSSPRPEQRRVSRACIVGGNVAGIHWHYINCKCPES